MDGAETAAAAGRPRSFLAFDFGTKRIGAAVGNTLLGSAKPLRTIAATGDARFTAIAALIAEWQPDALVIGVPRHPDGAPHEMTAMALRFGRQLHGRFRLAVHEVDERYSTTEAHSQGAGDVDAASAAIILDQFLRSLAAPVASPGEESDPAPMPAARRGGDRATCTEPSSGPSGPSGPSSPSSPSSTTPHHAPSARPARTAP